MTTALSLNAASTLVNGLGLAANTALLTQITTFQAKTPIVQLANIYAYVQTNANAAANLLPILETIGNTTNNNTQWLLDLCPTDTLFYITNVPAVYGNIARGTANYKPRFSTTISNQATGPFTGGLATFANVYQTVSSYAISNFDVVASANLLAAKTYADSGIGFTGPGDVATGGLGNSGPLLGSTISAWGTMYDIKNMVKIGDPYVFGQNLLNQRLGTYGNLSTQLTAVGLNINDLPTIPKSTTTTTQQSGTTVQQTAIGEIEIPGLVNVTTTTVITGSSPTVVKNIYANITASNLASIVSATQFSGNTAQLLTLDDYLDFNKVVPSAIRADLSSKLGVTDFTTFGQVLHDKIGQGNFKTWKELSDFLLTLEIPTLNNTTASSTTPLLNNITSLTNGVKGTGPFQNLVIADMLSSTAGGAYTTNFTTLNTNYNTVLTSSNLTSAMSNLVSCINSFMANVAAGWANTVSANVAGVTAALNNTPSTATLTLCQTAYTTIWANIQTEISALGNAGADYTSATTTTLKGFAQNFPTTASDKDKLQTYQFFGNLITNDANGDILRAAIAEVINTKLLGSKGITLNNDPNPAGAIAEAKRQNIPLSTYLSRNQ
jgi:hypothetical protein